jgi:methionyl-tRNA formyltransferase
MVEKTLMRQPLRLVFLGSDAIALPLLGWLAGEGTAQARVVAVFTPPDRPSGRGQRMHFNPVKDWALNRRLPVYQPERLGEESVAQLAALDPDLALVVAYGHLLGEAFIATPRLGTWNLHASLLPKFRGASPIQTAVACGERETGMAFMRIVRALDAGPVSGVERVPIGPLDTAADVEARLAAASVPLVGRVLPLLASGELISLPQDPSLATYCRRLTKEDGILDFTAAAPELAARINGLFPWPGCAIEVAGQQVRLGLADALMGSGPEFCAPAQNSGPDPLPPSGTVLGADADGLLVSAGGGVLRLRRMQRPGGRMLPAAEFLRGFPVAPGTILSSQPMTPLLR